MDEDKERVPLVPRLVVSLVVGLLVLLISLGVAFGQFCRSAIRYTQSLTLTDIGEVREAVEADRQEEGVLPRALPDSSQVTRRVDETGTPLDWWGRPLHYWTDGTHYRITSHGRDGRPGGVGLDYDLSSDDLPAADQDADRRPELPREATPTFGQFVTHGGEGGNSGSGRSMVLMSMLAGVAAFVLAFRTIGGTAPARRNLGALVLTLFVTAAAALFIGSMITAVHAPSGH